MKKQTKEFIARWLDDKGIDDFTKAYIIDEIGQVKQLDAEMYEEKFDGWSVKDAEVISKEIECNTFTLVPNIHHAFGIIGYIDDEGMYTQSFNLPFSEFYYRALCIEFGEHRIDEEFCHLFGKVFINFTNPIKSEKNFKVSVEE